MPFGAGQDIGPGHPQACKFKRFLRILPLIHIFNAGNSSFMRAFHSNSSIAACKCPFSLTVTKLALRNAERFLDGVVAASVAATIRA
ncbi:MAG: hypothetical protein EZS28_035192, partial [Streblomastix strix]